MRLPQDRQLDNKRCSDDHRRRSLQQPIPYCNAYGTDRVRRHILGLKEKYNEIKTQFLYEV